MNLIRHHRLLLHFFMGIALVMVYPMQALFSGNQNIYFLWAMHAIEPNAFTADPLLNSPDPYPLFSWLIAILPAQYFQYCITAIYVLLNAIYTYALFGIADKVASVYKHKTKFLSFVVLFLFLHTAPIWGTYFKLVFGTDLRWMWDSGIAEQGVLRGYLQPSVFGVFLLLSLSQLANRKHALAILCIIPAAVFHASYFFLGGIITLFILFDTNFGKKSLIAASILLLFVLPYAHYIFNHFMQLDIAMKTAIHHAVMAGYADNMHINPSNWRSGKFYLQIPLMLLGVAMLWHTQVRNLVVGLAILGILFTLLAYGMQNSILISLNPWRVTVLIMPIATVAILSKVVHNGIWTVIGSHILSFIVIISTALVVYRIFGHGSSEFIQTWIMIQLAAFVLSSITAGFIFRNETLKKLLVPLVICTLIFAGAASFYVESISKSNTEEYKAIAAINKTNELNTIYIIPPTWTSFRMNAQKAVYVDQNLVYGPALPNLMKRLDIMNAARENNNYSEVIASIAEGTTVKLIAPATAQLSSGFTRGALTENFHCFTLRQ